MISIKTDGELMKMRRVNRIIADCLLLLQDNVKEGVTTEKLNKIAHEYITGHGAVPSFLGYGGFPASICVSVNEVVIHGIPSRRALCGGDIVSIDVGAVMDGYHADAARTFPVGMVSEKAAELIRVTEESFFKAIEAVRDGARLGDIGHAVESHVTAHNFSVVRDFVGHGIGAEMHEDPQVPNYGLPNRGLKLKRNMTLAIEPMVNAGGAGVKILGDGWSVVTLDNELSAHYENTVAVTETGVEILSLGE